MENELHREPATPEEVWSFLRTSSEKAARETAELRKLMKETDQQMKETDRRLKKLDTCSTVRNSGDTIPDYRLFHSGLSYTIPDYRLFHSGLSYLPSHPAPLPSSIP